MKTMEQKIVKKNNKIEENQKKHIVQNPFEDLSFWLSLATADFKFFDDIIKSANEKEKKWTIVKIDNMAKITI